MTGARLSGGGIGRAGQPASARLVVPWGRRWRQAARRGPGGLAVVFVFVVALGVGPAPDRAAGAGGGAGPASLAAPANEPPRGRVTLLFFWGVGCPHCEDAKPFVAQLRREHPRLDVESIEVKRDAAGRQRFIETLQRLGATRFAVPTFVVGEHLLVGFAKGKSERQLEHLVELALQ